MPLDERGDGGAGLAGRPGHGVCAHRPNFGADDHECASFHQAFVPWASSGAVAATVIAPRLTTVNSADVYVDAETILGLEAAAAAAGLRPIEGGRPTLRPFPSVTARRLATRVDGLMVAPSPRVFADVRTLGVRGEEAAEHLRRPCMADDPPRTRAARAEDRRATRTSVVGDQPIPNGSARLRSTTRCSLGLDSGVFWYLWRETW